MLLMIIKCEQNIISKWAKMNTPTKLVTDKKRLSREKIHYHKDLQDIFKWLDFEIWLMDCVKRKVETKILV